MSGNSDIAQVRAVRLFLAKISYILRQRKYQISKAYEEFQEISGLEKNS